MQSDDRSPISSLREALSGIPARGEPEHAELNEEIADAAKTAARHHSEARRDAVLAVAATIKRRGQNPLSDWTTRDTDTAYAIADQLISLGH